MLCITAHYVYYFMYYGTTTTTIITIDMPILEMPFGRLSHPPAKHTENRSASFVVVI